MCRTSSSGKESTARAAMARSAAAGGGASPSSPHCPAGAAGAGPAALVGCAPAGEAAGPGAGKKEMSRPATRLRWAGQPPGWSSQGAPSRRTTRAAIASCCLERGGMGASQIASHGCEAMVEAGRWARWDRPVGTGGGLGLLSLSSCSCRTAGADRSGIDSCSPLPLLLLGRERHGRSACFQGQTSVAQLCRATNQCA